MVGALWIVGIIVLCVLVICTTDISPGIVLIFGVGIGVAVMVYEKHEYKYDRYVDGGVDLIWYIPKNTQPHMYKITNLTDHVVNKRPAQPLYNVLNSS